MEIEIGDKFVRAKRSKHIPVVLTKEDLSNIYNNDKFVFNYHLLAVLSLLKILMSSKVPQGLIFSSNRKKRAITLIAVLLVLQLCLIWPVYPIFSSPTPQILGFPLSFVWVILILICSFSSVLLFFLKDAKREA